MKTRAIRGTRSDRLPLVVSEDGYVRLTMAAFRAIRRNKFHRQPLKQKGE